MKKVYKDILENLDKGNIVLVEVKSKYKDSDRYRIIKGNESTYDFIDTDDGKFVDSCFVMVFDTYRNTGCIKYRRPKSSKELVELMEKYDSEYKLRIKQFMTVE